MIILSNKCLSYRYTKEW